MYLTTDKGNIVTTDDFVSTVYKVRIDIWVQKNTDCKNAALLVNGWEIVWMYADRSHKPGESFVSRKKEISHVLTESAIDYETKGIILLEIVKYTFSWTSKLFTCITVILYRRYFAS